MTRRCAIVIAIALFGTAAAGAESEEQRLVRIAQRLKPISDSQWNEIAGSKTAETYDIQKGDTLWDVSKRLFGNAYYWPKVWSMNGSIHNPHIVAPGQKLAFTPGSSESTPRLEPALRTAGETTASSPESKLTASASGSSGPVAHEYDKLPPSRWAPVDVTKQMEKEYDAYGIQREIRIAVPLTFSFRVPAIANDTTVPFLGEVVGSRRDGAGLSQHETLFLKSNSQDLQVGTTYSVLSEPTFVRERKSDRSGYVYSALGEVRIVSVKDELYVGVIEKAYDVIRRGDRVYPLLPLITDVKPLPARAALESLVVYTTAQSTTNSAQFRFIHFDRGIEDGIQVGNVFRLYDYYDPVTKNKITDSDFLINADALIVHATAQFSTAMIIRSRNTLGRGDFGVLLTDVSDIEKRLLDRDHTFGEDKGKTPDDKELDELDELDRTSGEGLGKKEEAEIKELDQWDKTKDLQTQPNEEPTVPSSPEVPTDEAEKLPGAEPGQAPTSSAQPSAPNEPTLDQTLDSPTVTPSGLEAPPPPANLKPPAEQTLDAPTAPSASGDPSSLDPGSSEPAPTVEPALQE